MSLLSSAQMLTCDMNKSQQNYMMSRTVAEQEIMNLRKELSDAHAKLQNAANAVALEAEQRSNQKVSYVARQYEERYSELKMNLEADCKKIVDKTVNHARQGMEDFKKKERAMIQEMKEECSRQEEQAAELNYQLQERIDEPVEKLNKQNVPTLRIEELDQGGNDIPVEAFATPKGTANVDSGVTPMPSTAMSNLAAEARERLHSVFSTTPVGSTAPPQLPPLPVQGHQQDTAQRKPSVRSATIAVSETDKLKTADLDAGLSGQQLLDLITRLTSQDADGEKPRTKEAETIKLNDMPAPEAYRQWRNHIRDEVKSCSDKPDEAWIWLNEVLTRPHGRSWKRSCKNHHSWHQVVGSVNSVSQRWSSN